MYAISLEEVSVAHKDTSILYLKLEPNIVLEIFDSGFDYFFTIAYRKNNIDMIKTMFIEKDKIDGEKT